MNFKKMAAAMTAGMLCAGSLCAVPVNAADKVTFDTWQEAYYEVLTAFSSGSGFYSKEQYGIGCSMYQIMDLDSNGIPELMISDGVYDVSTVRIYSFSGNMLTKPVFLGSYGVVYTDEENKNIGYCITQNGSSVMRIFRYEKGEFVKTAEYYDDNVPESLEKMNIPLGRESYFEDLSCEVNGVKYDFMFDHYEPSGYNEKYVDENKKIEIGDEINSLPVTTIKDEAFSNCETAESIKIGGNITDIGMLAFASCDKIKAFEIPEKVSKIGKGAFMFCVSATEFNVDKANKNFISADGVLYDKSGKTLIAVPLGTKTTSFTVPDTVTRVDDLAFAAKTDLEEIVFPEKLETVGFGAFLMCMSLEKVTFKGSGTKIDNEIPPYMESELEEDEKEQADAIPFSFLNNLFFEGKSLFYGTFYCYDNSQAEAYADKFAINKILINPSAKERPSLGDVNGDWIIDARDASCTLLAYALASASQDIPMSYDLAQADATGDEKVDSRDASLILRYYASSSAGYTGTLQEFAK